MKDKTFIKYFIGLAIPVVIQQLLVNLLAITDTIMVGAISENAISATTVANKFFLIYNLAIFGLTNGIGLFISQFFGACDKENCNKTLRFGLLCVIGLSIIGTGILILFPNFVIEIFVKDEDIIQLALQYNNIVRYSYLPYGIAQMMGIANRSKGNTLFPLYTGFVSFVSNIFLNYILIFGKLGCPELGIQGAALATSLSRFIEMAILLLASFKKEDYYCFLNKYGMLSKENRKEILNKTIPLIFNETIWSLSLSLIFMNYCYVSEQYVPSLTVVDQVGSLSYVVFAGFSSAVGVVIGNTLGSNQLEEAKKLAKLMIKIGLMINIIMAVLVSLFSHVIPKAYFLTKESTTLATQLILIKCAVMWTQGYSETIYYILRAGGDTKSVFFIDGFFMTCGPLLMSTIFSRLIPLDLLYVFMITEGICVLKIFVSTFFYKKGTWIKNLTVEI